MTPYEELVTAFFKLIVNAPIHMTYSKIWEAFDDAMKESKAAGRSTDYVERNENDPR